MCNNAIFSPEYVKYNESNEEAVVSSLYKLPGRHSQTFSWRDLGKSFLYSNYSDHDIKPKHWMDGEDYRRNGNFILLFSAAIAAL